MFVSSVAFHDQQEALSAISFQPSAILKAHCWKPTA